MWRRGGVKEPIPGEPQWPIDVLWIPPLPRPPWKTNQRSGIPVMRGWTGGSDDWQCQKRQTDPAEWGLMIWNRLLQFAGLQGPRVAQSQSNSHSKTNLEVFRIEWKNSMSCYRQALKSARTEHFRKLIDNNQNNPRFLFSTVARLTNKQMSPDLNITSQFNSNDH